MHSEPDRRGALRLLPLVTLASIWGMCRSTCPPVSSLGKTSDGSGTISRQRFALSWDSPLLLRSKMSRNFHGGRGPHRWRAALIVVFVTPAVLCASAVKLARASFYKAQPILCDGVDDDAAAVVLCALPEETTKARPHPCGKDFFPAIFRPRGIPAGTQLVMMSSPDSPLRLKRQLAQDAGSSDDPDKPH
jgi:hypothetical protein